ncbi:MAG: asparagine--tRNA ligase, partial [Clostridia bacterium]
ISGKSTPDYPLQNKRHTMEFLREHAHLRARTSTFSAVFRVRSVLANEIHNYFNNLGYVYINTPIITSSDGEGAGEMFKVTTDDKKDFFGKDAYLTVTGQLMAECMMMGLSSVYTFGPTFRAENSNTTRHAAEFWMMEPEIAFADLNECMNIEEDMVRTVIKNTMIRCEDEIKFFNDFIDKNLINKLNNVVDNNFERITYTDAIDILIKNNDNFEYKVEWGTDIATEHERYIAEVIYKKPVFITDYPKEIKAFYMKQNDDNKTVAAVDLVVPGIGEMIGGSQREEDYDKLVNRMKELNMNIESYDWYLDVRKYGTCVHSGFGLGFERLIMYVTGITNIRDTIPFPRTVGNLKY